MNGRMQYYWWFPDQYLNNYAVIRTEYQMCKARAPYDHKVEAERIVRAPV